MTVLSEVNENTYIATGVQTVFPAGFTFQRSTEVIVSVSADLGVTYAAATGYAVVGLNVVFTVAPANAVRVRLQRTVPFTQAVALRSQGTFSPATLEGIADEGVFQCQQLDRRLKFVESGGATGSVTAGSGLKFTGIQLDVGAVAGSGITVNADDIAVTYGAASAMVAVDKSAASAGVASTSARIDHKHDVTTAVPVNIDPTANSEGIASTIARSDHKHYHGALTGGGLHVPATNAAAGFMSLDDKNKSDLRALGYIQTTNATASSMNFNDVHGLPGSISGGVWITRTNEEIAVTFHVTVTGRSTDGDAISFGRACLVTRAFAAGPTLVGSTVLWSHATAVATGWSLALSVSNISTTIDIFNVTVTGAASKTINWTAEVVQTPARPTSSTYLP